MQLNLLLDARCSRSLFPGLSLLLQLMSSPLCSSPLCASLIFSSGCATDGFWALEAGFIADKDRDHSVEQRFAPTNDIAGDPTFPAWRAPGDRGFTPGKLITECLTEENMARGADRKWWTVPGEQPGARILGTFVTKYFGYILARPYSSSMSYNCRANTANQAQYSVHSEGRAIDFPIPTWPCGDTIFSKWYGNPTCGTYPGGSARNDLGDRLAMWLVRHAGAIGLEYMIWDRTSWSRRWGFKEYARAHPHNEHIHIQISRAAAANPGWFEFYTSPESFAPTTSAYPPLGAVPGATTGRRLQMSSAVEMSGYELVSKNSYCSSANGAAEYLASFDNLGNILQDYLPGLQACANRCAQTEGCIVFRWKNHKEEYYTAELADYDNRPCYMVKVSSRAECEPGARSTSSDVYALTGTSNGLFDAEERYEAEIAEEEQPPDGALISIQPSNARFATGSNGDLLVSYAGGTGSGSSGTRATFELVQRNTICNYEKGRTYLKSFDQKPSILQDGMVGLQACANKCRETSGCVVFAWKNRQEQYYDPDLKDYDSRPCYQINVASAAECGLHGRRDQIIDDTDVYTLYTEVDSVTLVFDLAVKVSGEISCPGSGGWSGAVELPLTQGAVTMQIVPSAPLGANPIDSMVQTWLAKATADSIRIGTSGELQLGAVSVPPFALVKASARCATQSLWLGDLATAQKCADMCAGINQRPSVLSGNLEPCRFFTWRSPDAQSNAQAFQDREEDGCFMQMTSDETCPEGCA